MRFDFSYALRLDDGEWKDITPVVDSRQTVITRNVCTTDFKSAVDTASFVMQPAPEFYPLRSDIVDMMMSALSGTESHVYARIGKGQDTLFTGVVDLSNFTLLTNRLPAAMTINCEDLSTVFLDEVPSSYIVLENKKISEIVEALVEAAGYVMGSKAMNTGEDVTLRAFVASPEEDDTYRDYIDTLLFEAGGYVLDCDETGVMNIVRIPYDATVNPDREITNYISADGVSSSTRILDHDGVTLKWSTLAETDPDDPQVVYTADIDLEQDEEGNLVGYHLKNQNREKVEIEDAQDYWPETGNEEMTYQEFEADFLDKEYLSKQKKTQNRDLSLILVKNVSMSIAAYMRNRQEDIDDPHGFVLTDGWIPVDANDIVSFPASLATAHDMPSNPTIYPDRAWYLMQATGSDTKGSTLEPFHPDLNITAISLQGDCVYRNRINTMQLPALSRKPDEYESIYIYGEEHAKRFASFYHHIRLFSRTTHTWSELGASATGQRVVIGHKHTEVGQDAYIVQVKLSVVGNQLKSTCIAISLGEYDEYEVKTDGVDNGPVGRYDSVMKITDYYLVSDRTSGITVQTPGWTTDAQFAQSADGSYLWSYKETAYYTGMLSRSIPVIVSYKNSEPARLDASVNRDRMRYYADNYPYFEDDTIEVTAKATNIPNKTISVRWYDMAGGAALGSGSIPNAGGTISIPVADLTGVEEGLRIEVTCDVWEQELSVYKDYLQGFLSISTDKDYFEFYADNYPHDDDDTLTIVVASDGYKATPVLTVGGEVVEYTEGQTYVLPVSAMQDRNTLIVKATVADATVQRTLRKVKDVGTLTLLQTGSQFFYYADNYPLNTEDYIQLRIVTYGYKSEPVLKLNGQAVQLDGERSYTVHALDMLNLDTIAIEASCYDSTRTSSILKVRNQAYVAIMLSSTFFTYYADNVPVENQDSIVVTVTQNGLYYGVELYVDGKKVTLDDNLQATILPSALSAKTRIEVKVNSVKLPSSVTASAYITKSMLTPGLVLQTDAAQFSFDSNGVPSPTSINITYSTSGLSSAVVPTLLVKNQPAQWGENRTYTMYAAEVADVTYVRVIASLAEHGLTREVVIGKVSSGKDGVIPIYQYQYGASPTDPPEDVFLTWDEFLLEYGGKNLTWSEGTWEGRIQPPAPADRPYLWMRISTDNGVTWNYFCCTIDGPKGDKGDKGDPGTAGEYLGPRPTPPTERPDGSPLQEGDYYLNTADKSNPLPYIMQANGTWRLVSATDTEWSVIAGATQGDVAALGSSLMVTNSYYGYFSLLSAIQATFDTVHTTTMVIKDGGHIVSQSNIDSDGVDGFDINENGIFANSGSWNAGINSGTLRCIPNSRLADGRDAFDFRTDTTLGEYWARFKALKVNTNIFLHTPEDFREYYRCIRNGRFDAPVRETTKDFYGVRPLPIILGQGVTIQSPSSTVPLIMALLNRRYLVGYTQSVSGSVTSMYINFYDVEKMPVTDDLDGIVYDFTIDVSSYGSSLWSLLVDEEEGKAYCIFVGNASTEVLPVYSFPIQDEYTSAPVLTKETFTNNFSSIVQVDPITFILQSYNRMYVDGGLRVYLSAFLQDGSTADKPQRIMLFDAKAKSITVKASFECHYDLSVSTAPSIFFYGVQEVDGVMYGLATVPQTGLCLVKINGDDDIDILKIFYDDDEDTWGTYPWGKPGDSDEAEAPVYCSADMSVHGNRLLICISKKVKNLAKVARPWDKASNFYWHDDPCIATDSLVGWYDVVADTFTEMDIPKARLMPSIHNDDATTKSFYYISNSNINGMRPQELSLIPKTLRYNRITQKYDLFGVMIDVALGSIGILLGGTSGVKNLPYPSFKLNGFYCRFSADMEFEQGMTQKKASAYEAVFGLYFTETIGSGANVSFLSRSRDLTGDMYLPDDLPLYYSRNDIYIDSIPQPDDTLIFSYPIVWGYRKSQKDTRHKLLDWLFNTVDEVPATDRESMLATYEDYYDEEPALGRITGFRTRYNVDDDSYDIEFITDSKVSRYDNDVSVQEAQKSFFSEAGFGVENGNGTYSFDDFIPDITLKEGDTTLCPITVNLHTNAFTYFDN